MVNRHVYHLSMLLSRHLFTRLTHPVTHIRAGLVSQNFLTFTWMYWGQNEVQYLILWRAFSMRALRMNHNIDKSVTALWGLWSLWACDSSWRGACLPSCGSWRTLQMLSFPRQRENPAAQHSACLHFSAYHLPSFFNWRQWLTSFFVPLIHQYSFYIYATKKKIKTQGCIGEKKLHTFNF